MPWLLRGRCEEPGRGWVGGGSMLPLGPETPVPASLTACNLPWRWGQVWHPRLWGWSWGDRLAGKEEAAAHCWPWPGSTHQATTSFLCLSAFQCIVLFKGGAVQMCVPWDLSVVFYWGWGHSYRTSLVIWLLSSVTLLLFPSPCRPSPHSTDVALMEKPQAS